MSNGLAVRPKDGSFDLWKDKRCTSGYLPIEGCFTRLFRRELVPHLWVEYSPQFILAVPEKLVWWQDE